MAVEFRLLGDVEVEIDGRLVELGHARQRCVLVALLLDADRLVPVDRLAERVWGDRPPQRARNALAGYLSRLRAVLGTGAAITREPGGYRLVVDPEAVDLHRFRRLVAEARTAAEPSVPLDGALGLWRGEAAFAALDSPWLAAVRTALDVERLAAELDRTELALRRGEHEAVLAPLSARAAEHPLDERVAGQLMRALYACGRQADALEHYRLTRQRLADDLGIDPGAELRLLHQQILTADPRLVAHPPAASGGEAPVPRQLPAAPPAFAGREPDLAELDALLAGTTGGTAACVVVAVISGTAGVGKTALALQWAHRVAGSFPDGQLYLNLRGFDPGGAMMSTTEALRGLLDAFAIPAPRIPVGPAAQAALYRSLLAGRRVLVVLDNARDAEQVRPLLPGSPGCVAVVTSRDHLAGLVATGGAHPLTLDLLTAAEARELLAGRIGADRLTAEPAAADEIVTRCGRLPLALAVVAARAATHREFSLADLAAEMAAGAPLDPFDGGDPAADVRAVFSWSYRALRAPAARLFRLLGLHPGPDAGVPAVASLAALPAGETRALLAELARAHLITEPAPGRYAFHDLLQAYAAEQARLVDPAPVRTTAARRLLDHYLHTAYADDRLLYPHRDPIDLPGRGTGVVPERHADSPAAMRWFLAEHQVLLTTVEQAAHGGFGAELEFDHYAWLLAWSLTSFFNLRGYWADQIAVQTTALAAARRRADQAALAHVHRNLGRAYTQVRHVDLARAHLEEALALFTALDDQPNEAQVHVNLGRLLERTGDGDAALDHDHRSLDLYRAAGHLAGQARALNNLGAMYARRGELHRAEGLCQESLALHQRLGNIHGAATAWDSLGVVHHRAGRHAAAAGCYQRAIELFGRFGDHTGEAGTLMHLGEAHFAMDNREAARDAWQDALVLMEPQDHPDTGLVRRRLGELEHDQPARA